MAHHALVDSAIHEAIHRSLVASKNSGRFFGVVGVGHHNATAGGAAPGGGPGNTPGQFDQFLFNPQTRTRCYQAALKIAADQPKLKVDVANMLLLHLSGFVPQLPVLEAVRDFAAANASDGSEYRELQRLADIQLVELQRYSGSTVNFLTPPSPNRAMSSPQPADLTTEGSGIPTVTMAGGASGGAHHHYTTMPALRGPLVENSRRIVTMGLPPAHEVAVVASEKNSRLLRNSAAADATTSSSAAAASTTAQGRQLNFNIVHCKDVTAQTPVTVTEGLLQQQIKVLISYTNDYSRSPSVALATRMFIKLLLDSYRKRLKLQPYTQHMRIATCAFLTPLLALVGSEYQNVKLQVYDILSNLAVQSQLFDRSTVDGLPGSSIEAECWWMLAQTLQREFLMGKKDRNRDSDTIWYAALKCTMFVLPPHLLATYVDPRVLVIFCNLPGVSENSVGLYALLLDALATQCCSGFSSQRLKWRSRSSSRSYKQPSGGSVHSRSGSTMSALSGGGMSTSTNKPTQGPSQDALQNLGVTNAAGAQQQTGAGQPRLELDSDSYHLVGGDVTFCQLYAKATTAAARDSAFMVLYCSAALQSSVGLRHAATPPPGDLSQAVGADEKLWASVLATLNAVAKIGLPWHFHTFLLFQSATAAKDLCQQIIMDIRQPESALDKEDKSFLINTLTKVVEIAYARTQALPAGLEGLDLTTAALLLPGMMKDGDAVVQSAAIAAAVAAVQDELTRKPSEAELKKGVTRDCMPLFRALCAPTSAAQRGCNVQVLERLAALARTLPSAVLAFTQLYDLVLNNGANPNVAGGRGSSAAMAEPLTTVHYLPMYRALVSLLTRQQGGRGEGDLSEQCLSGALQVVQSSADQVGSQLLWSLYFVLRPVDGTATTADGNSAAGAATCRARHVLVNILAPMSSKDPASDLYIWSRVLEDPYPAVAVIGAQQVIRNCGLAHYDRYEAAITQAEQGQKPSDVLKSAFHMASSIVGK